MSAAERIQQWHWGKILMLWILVPTLGVAVGAIVLAVADAGFQSEVPGEFFHFCPLSAAGINSLDAGNHMGLADGERP